MKAEDSYFICEVEVYPVMDGRFIMYPHVMNNRKYYKAGPIETRYVIRRPLGIANEHVYKSQIQTTCCMFESKLAPTNRYIRTIDASYFKYYDDAEEVLNNIILFILWIKEIAVTRKWEKQFVKIAKENEFLVRDTDDSPEEALIRASQIGLKVKRRSEQDQSVNILDIKDWLKSAESKEKEIQNTLKPKEVFSQEKKTESAPSAKLETGFLFTM
jgi:hypothetical protein